MDQLINAFKTIQDPRNGTSRLSLEEYALIKQLAETRLHLSYRCLTCRTHKERCEGSRPCKPCFTFNRVCEDDPDAQETYSRGPPIKACLSCRTAKVKCDLGQPSLGQPSCGRCVKTGRECSLQAYTTTVPGKSVDQYPNEEVVSDASVNPINSARSETLLDDVSETQTVTNSLQRPVGDCVHV
jgi:hypothetical protein